MKFVNITVEIRPNAFDAFIAWQADFNEAIGQFPGFISLEFVKEQNSWLIVQCFSDSESYQKWRESAQYNALITQLKSHIQNHSFKEVEGDESIGKGSITEIFVTEVSAGKEESYLKWSSKIHQIEAKFPGFRGVYLQSPAGKDKYWITLLQFDCSENLERWLKSPEREQVLKESSSLVSYWSSHRFISPYAGWFASITETGKRLPLWKQTMLILLVLFPIVMLEMRFLSPLTEHLNKALGMFIGNAISVSLISFPMMPLALKFLGWWVTTRNFMMTLAGTAIVILLYLIELAIFWNQ